MPLTRTRWRMSDIIEEEKEVQPSKNQKSKEDSAYNKIMAKYADL